MHTLPCYSQVFKCKTSSGDTTYQSKKCSPSTQQKKIVIKPFDPEKIIKAQRSLRLELIQRNHDELARRKQEFQQQQIEALKTQTQNSQELTKALRENSALIREEDPTAEHYYYFNNKFSRYRPKKQTGNNQPKQTERGPFNPPSIR